MNQKLLKVLPIFLLALLNMSQAIKFNYILGVRQIQCFHQSAQKGTRYQIDIKSNSSYYSLQVFQENIVHTDSRTEEFYKYLSAFANSDFGINFCLNSLADHEIELQVQFYHGFYLENSQQLKGANQFLSMTRKMQEISNLIIMNYNKYRTQIIQRQPINNRIQIYATMTIIIFLIIVSIVKMVYFNKVVKFMKVRKII